MMRRIGYFHEVMNRNDDEITKKVVLSQGDKKTKGDFHGQVDEDLSTLGIDKEDVVNWSKTKLKEVLKKETSKSAFLYLIDLAKSHSKVNDSVYTDLNGMTYMNDPRFTPDLVTILFKFRTRMFNVKNNFRNNYRQTNTLCPLCNTVEDSQQHLFHCTEIRKQIPSAKSNHDDIFSMDLDVLLTVAKELKIIVAVREELERETLDFDCDGQTESQGL